ncbi:MAG TPA: VOC family protein [bacterium]|nr:VOC family protein [bacterium]
MGMTSTFGRIGQIALVVRDLDKAMRAYWEILGVGPWRVYTYGPPLVRDMTYRGRKQDYRMRLALAQARDLTLELIQPLSGESLYTEHLQQKGEGLHHVGFVVDSLTEAIAEAAKLRLPVLQSGRGYGLDGDGGYAYLDTESQLGMIAELIEIPKRRRSPEAEFPTQSPDRT